MADNDLQYIYIFSNIFQYIYISSAIFCFRLIPLNTSCQQMPIELNSVHRGRCLSKISKYLIIYENTNKFVGVIGTNRNLFQSYLVPRGKKKVRTTRRTKISMRNFIVNHYLSIFSIPRTVQTPENSQYLIHRYLVPYG